MLIRFNLIILLCANSIFVFSQNIIFNDLERIVPIQRVFVFANDGTNCRNEIAGSQDIATLVETKLLRKYEFLERRYFTQVLEEQKLSASGIMLEESAVALGRNSGSQGVIFTEVGCLEGDETVSIKLVGCETSEIYWSCVGVNLSAIDLIDQLVFQLTGEKPSGNGLYPNETNSDSKSKTTSTQCTGIAKSTGKRCRLRTYHESGRCHHHREQP